MIIKRISQLEINGIEELDRYSITTTMPLLNGSKYKLRLTYNKIDEHVYIDVSDIDDNRIISGTKLIFGYEIFVPSSYALDDKLKIVCIPTTTAYNKEKVSVYDIMDGTVILMAFEGDRNDE